MCSSDLDEISGGRFVLGIGAGDRPLLALGLKPGRLATLESAIGAIRRLWSGGVVDASAAGFRLDGAHLRFGARAGIEVYVSASGPRTLELAGRVADGVILLVGLFPEALEWAIARVDEGARAAGRPRPRIAVFAYGAIDEDETAALESARSIAAWFPQTAPFICELAGLPAETAERVRAGYAGGEFQEAAAAAAALPDDFVRKVALAGNRDSAARAVSAALAAGADSVSVFPLGAARMATVRSFASLWPHANGPGASSKSARAAGQVS